MATLTIQISDDLAEKLRPHEGHIEQLLHLGLERLASTSNPLHEEVISFLASGPTTAEISNLQPSEEAQTRIRKLLEKNRDGSLTEAEAAELDQIEALNHLITRLKISAKKQLSK